MAKVKYRSIPTTSKYLNNAFFSQQKWTMEHVVPRSYMKKAPRFKNMVKDGHNIILYPSTLNSHRSNYQITDEGTINIRHPDTTALNVNGKKLTCDDEIMQEQWKGSLSWKNSKKRQFVPAWTYRGEIARACYYMYFMYPELHETQSVFPMTINHKIAEQWNSVYYPSMWEVQKFHIICGLQNQNPKTIKHPLTILPF